MTDSTRTRKFSSAPASPPGPPTAEPSPTQANHSGVTGPQRMQLKQLFAARARTSAEIGAPPQIIRGGEDHQGPQNSALTAMVLGLTVFVTTLASLGLPFLLLPALVLGIIALGFAVRARRRIAHGEERSSEFARAGFALSILSLVITVAILLLYLLAVGYIGSMLSPGTFDLDLGGGGGSTGGQKTIEDLGDGSNGGGKSLEDLGG